MGVPHKVIVPRLVRESMRCSTLVMPRSAILMRPSTERGCSSASCRSGSCSRCRAGRPARSPPPWCT
eukprot:scaffold104344_cov61-Phaeocystis_antarctica.AAC.3